MFFLGSAALSRSLLGLPGLMAYELQSILWVHLAKHFLNMEPEKGSFMDYCPLTRFFQVPY